MEVVMEAVIALLVVFVILILVDGAAFLWGMDSRDGRDWRTDSDADTVLRRRSG
jgi:cbb3-type cytochrome oxidase maturation protein